MVENIRVDSLNLVSVHLEHPQLGQLRVVAPTLLNQTVPDIFLLLSGENN